MPIFEQLVAPALDSVKGIIEQFHESPEDKAKAQQALADVAAKAQLAAADYDSKLNQVASDNIRADTTSGDKFTARARPSFLYCIIAVLAFDYIAIPLAGICGSHMKPIELPGDLLSLFGVAMCGYSFSRTAEKIAALPGDSQMSFLGLKIGNKQ